MAVPAMKPSSCRGVCLRLKVFMFGTWDTGVVVRGGNAHGFRAENDVGL